MKPAHLATELVPFVRLGDWPQQPLRRTDHRLSEHGKCFRDFLKAITGILDSQLHIGKIGSIQNLVVQVTPPGGEPRWLRIDCHPVNGRGPKKWVVTSFFEVAAPETETRAGSGRLG